MTDDWPLDHQGLVNPEHPWEVPVTPVRLVAAALEAGRPGGVPGPRLDGLSDAEVAVRYQNLRHLVLTHAAARPGQAMKTGSERLQELEALPPGAAAGRWEPWIASTGTARHPEVIRAARRVWEALGVNEYARSVKGRPRTSKGFVEGRLWLVAGVAPTIPLVMAGVESPSGFQHAAFFTAGLLWPLLVLTAFRRRLNRLRRIGNAELPHF